jgi:hypothetical protein
MEAESRRIFGGQKVLLQETDRVLTPFGGMVVFLEFLNKIGFVKKVIECMPVTHRSPNSIPPSQTYIAFLIFGCGGCATVRADQLAAGRPGTAWPVGN